MYQYCITVVVCLVHRNIYTYELLHCHFSVICTFINFVMLSLLQRCICTRSILSINILIQFNISSVRLASRLFKLWFLTPIVLHMQLYSQIVKIIQIQQQLSLRKFSSISSNVPHFEKSCLRPQVLILIWHLGLKIFLAL